MALTQQDLQAIALLLKPIDRRLDTIERDVSTLKTDVSGLKADVSTLKADVSGLKSNVSGLKLDVSTLKTDVSELKETVNKNYGMLEEFYVHQKEHNTEIMDTLSIIEGELAMHNNQIARNTAQLQCVK